MPDRRVICLDLVLPAETLIGKVKSWWFHNFFCRATTRVATQAPITKHVWDKAQFSLMILNYTLIL